MVGKTPIHCIEGVRCLASNGFRYALCMVCCELIFHARVGRQATIGTKIEYIFIYMQGLTWLPLVPGGGLVGLW